MLYTISIFIAIFLIIGINLLIDPSVFNLGTWYIVKAVLFSALAVVAIDGICAFVVRHLCPAKWFDHNKKFFQVEKKECFFYEKLGIKKWKDKVLELGFFAGFRKNKLTDPYNNEYVERFLLENTYGIIVHLTSIIFGILIIFLYPLQYVFLFGLPVFVVNAFYNYLSYMILRYNIPKLKTLYKFNLRKKQNQNQDNNQNIKEEE